MRTKFPACFCGLAKGNRCIAGSGILCKCQNGGHVEVKEGFLEEEDLGLNCGFIAP